jgi:hypothetical protein
MYKDEQIHELNEAHPAKEAIHQIKHHLCNDPICIAYEKKVEDVQLSQEEQEEEAET